MTYIPVGTILTYTAQVNTSLLNGFNGAGTLENLLAKLKTELETNLAGYEEFDVSNAHGNPSFVGPSSISLNVLNNGVDHGSESDVQSIIDGTLQNMGVPLLSSNITSIHLPNNPVVNTGATSNEPYVNPDGTPKPESSIFSGFSLGGGTIAGISITVIIIAIVALVLLLPGNARRLVAG
jgi:hypothetical protein